MTQILVIGTGHAETYTDIETRASHTRIGGPAGIIAQELHRGGHQPLLHISFNSDHHGRNTARLLNQSGVWWEHSTKPSNQPSSFADIKLRRQRHHRTTGCFPVLTDRDLDVAHLQALTESFPWVIIDSNVDANVIRRIGSRAQNLVLLPSAVSRVNNVLEVGTEVHKQLITCNEAEARRMAGTPEFKFVDLQRSLNTEALMVTFGKRGWAYRDAHHAFKCNAPTPPPACDFIGAGDSATAGAVHALVTGEPTAESVNQYLNKRFKYTVSCRYPND